MRIFLKLQHLDILSGSLLNLLVYFLTRMSVLGFRPKHVTKKLIGELPDRAQDVIIKRFGLGPNAEIMTLEAIGSTYGITRERVRQIENHALNKIRQSEAIEALAPVFVELEALIESLGGVVPEEELLANVSNQPGVQNHVYLLLTLGDSFIRQKENQYFKHRWHVGRSQAEVVHDALQRLHKSFEKDELISDDEIIDRFLSHLETDKLKEGYHSNPDVLRRWLSLSKTVDRNPLGEWGLSASPNVRVKGMRDYAYLVIRQHGSPMHFTEVTKKIRELFGKKAHVATTHNELIKDERFVLVGRGLYALAEWGYMRGIVKDVIAQILAQHGPLTKEEVIERVLKERYVKPNTILVNLQDMDRFNRTEEGFYSVSV
jgi:hypothetical protein